MQFFRPPASRPLVDASLMRLVQTDLVEQLRAGMHNRALGHGLVAGVIVLLLSEVQSPAVLWGWYGGLLLLLGLVTAWMRRVCAAPDAGEPAARLRSFVWAEALVGLAWLLGELLFLPGIDLAHRAMAFFFLVMWSSALMQSLSAHPPALHAAWLPMFVGVLFVSLAQPGPFSAVGRAVMVIWVAMILTFTYRLQRTLKETLRLRHQADALAVALQAEKDRALELSQSRSRFLAAASHDLRQPVHALLLFVAALRQQPPADEARQLLRHVDDTVRSMERMFNGLLEMSRLDAGMVRPVVRPVDLLRLLAPVVAEESAVAAARGLSVTLVAGAGPTMAVQSDPLMLERIVRNLLSNAVRYTRQGGVLLQVRQRSAAVDIRVADTGIGIAPEHRQAVYQEFFQVHARGTGLGLGLSIVQRMCDLLGHRLTLRSRLGRGSIFTVRLPCAPRPSAPAQPEAQSQVGSPAFPSVGDVLVVAEHADTRLALRALITGWGHRVQAVGQAGDLREPGAALVAAPCAIVCDGGPGTSAQGIATIEQLRMEFNEDIPAVLLFEPASSGALALPPLPGLAAVARPVNEQALRAAFAAVLQTQG